MERYSNVEGVLNYLGRYVRGGPIGNGRIVAFDGATVTFRYADNRDKEPSSVKGKAKVMTLSVDEFLRRFLEHVPPSGLRVVRSYGVYANAAKRNALSRARRVMGQEPAREPRRASIDAVVAKLRCPYLRCCPACGKRLVRVGELPLRRPRATTTTGDPMRSMSWPGCRVGDRPARRDQATECSEPRDNLLPLPAIEQRHPPVRRTALRTGAVPRATRTNAHVRGHVQQRTGAKLPAVGR